MFLCAGLIREISRDTPDDLACMMCRLEVRAFMAAQNLSMANTGAAVLNAFMRYSEGVSGGAKNKLIVTLNKVFEEWKPLLVKFSGGYGPQEKVIMSILRQRFGLSICHVILRS